MKKVMKAHCAREMVAARLLLLLGGGGKESCKFGEKESHSDYNPDWFEDEDEAWDAWEND